MHHPVLAALAAGFFASCAATQTFIVDEQNGPGTNYTSIAAAIANVPEGAVLQVRTGTYTRFRIDDQSITISCDPGVAIVGTLAPTPLIEIANLSAGKFVSIRGVTFQFVLASLPISGQNCAGAIALDDVVTSASGQLSSGRMVFTNCDHVAIRNSRLESVGLLEEPINCFNSNVTLTDTAVVSGGLCFRQGGGRLVLSDCTLLSAPTAFALAVGVMAGGELVLNDGTTLDSNAPSIAPALEGEGTVTMDPSVTLGANVGPAGAAITLRNEAVPAATADPDMLGGNATAAVTLPTGSTGALFVGFPGTPTTHPGIAHAFWLAPGCSAAAIGTGTLNGSYAVPNAPFVLGVQVTWQGVAWAPGTNYAATSNPATYAHH